MRTHYFIFIRPPGSHMWTMKMNGLVPWVSFDPNIANDMAISVAEGTKYCAMVQPVRFPKKIDTSKYALLADGETKFTPT